MESVLSFTGFFRPAGVVPSMAPVLRPGAKIVCLSVRRGGERRGRPRNRPPSDLSKSLKEPDRKEINGLWTKVTKDPDDDGKEPEWRVVIVKDGEIVEDPWLTARRKRKEEPFDRLLPERRMERVPEEETVNERLWYTKMMAERQEREKELRKERTTAEPWSALRRKMTMAARAEEEAEEEEEEESLFPSDLDLAGRGQGEGPPSFPGRGSLFAKLPKPPPVP